MKKIFLALVSCLLIISASSFAQGILRGKIADDKGETLIGVVVSLKDNRTVGTSTDLDGNYSIKIADSLPHVVQVSYVSYKTQEITISAKKGEVIVKDFIMESSLNELKVVEVTAKAVKSRDNYMDKLKMNSATTIDFVSAETMKKTGDVNVVAAVSRVSGVSTNGGFITVRGIGDRYVKTAINGSRIPTLDPFTNNIKLDMFPASLVDNIIITKTASPDLPGDWAGAYLSVETKDYPDKLAVNYETSFGYNDQTTFKEVVSSDRSSTDWLGYDKNFRDHDHGSVPAFISQISTYQEYVALGLGNYLNSLGYTAQWDATHSGDKTVQKLGLEQLGLLSKAQFNDDQAVAAAIANYNSGTYRARAFDIINAAAIKSNQSFANNWNTTKRRAPLNLSQSFSIGNQFNLFGRPFGFIAGIRYTSFTQFDPNAVSNRDNEATPDNVKNGVVQHVDSSSRAISRETNAWSALVNLAYKYSPNHSISLLFMPNVIGVNNVFNGTESGIGGGYNANSSTITRSQFYESRKQLVYQLKSEHYIPEYKLKLDLNASYTNGSSVAPDFKNLTLPGDPSQQNSLNVDGHRYYRYLDENVFDSRLSAELPLGNTPDLVRKLKFGGAYQRSDRRYDQYDYAVKNGSEANKLILGHEADDPFSLDKFGVFSVIDDIGPTHTVTRYYQEDGAPYNHTFGYSTIKAGYLMTDYSITQKLRFAGGLRVEQAKIYTDVILYDSLKYATDDIRRQNLSATSGNGINNPGQLNKISYLPSASLIYKLNNDDEAARNIRFNFSQTVARPSIRELSDVAAYDYFLRSDVVGNPNLKMVQINNYDVRFESNFKSGDNISVSAFHKDFKNHIELVDFGVYGYSWVNNAKASTLNGIEFEGRKVLTKHFDVRANVTLVKSQSTFIRTFGNQKPAPGDTVTRTMYGQAPYVINGILSYNSDSLGLNIALSYNIQGDKLVIGSRSGIPDIYERPRNLLDIKISKTLDKKKHFNVSLKVNDILNAAIVRSYKFPGEGFILDYDRYRYGTTYVLSFAYKL